MEYTFELIARVTDHFEESNDLFDIRRQIYERLEAGDYDEAIAANAHIGSAGRVTDTDEVQTPITR